MRDRWLLPDGVEEVLPEDAWHIEQARQRLLNVFRSWGFELVMPPMVEYLESLLTGAGEELATRTFTVTDQITGRLMGIRADMTPQVARIDAHYLSSALDKDTDRAPPPSRLCYAGTTLQTLPRTLGGSREPYQFGAELFGIAAPEGDCEIVCLMTECLSSIGFDHFMLDFGQVGVFRGLAEHFGANDAAQKTIFDALLTKSVADIEAATKAAGLSQAASAAFCDLTDYAGDYGVIDDARRRYSDVHGVVDALNNLDEVVTLVRQHAPKLSIGIDLAETRGYRYHTGVVYSLLSAGSAKPIARGGRYDNVGMAFGRGRAGTGFSGDLRQLYALTTASKQMAPIEDPIVAAPFSATKSLVEEIARLRDAGYRVIRLFPGQRASDLLQCDFELVETQDEGLSTEWELRALN